jgi:hypothetical protein
MYWALSMVLWNGVKTVNIFTYSCFCERIEARVRRLGGKGQWAVFYTINPHEKCVITSQRQTKKGETYDRLTSFRHHIFKGERQAKNEYANYHCLAKCAMPSIVLTHLHDVIKGRLEI